MNISEKRVALVTDVCHELGSAVATLLVENGYRTYVGTNDTSGRRDVATSSNWAGSLDLRHAGTLPAALRELEGREQCLDLIVIVPPEHTEEPTASAMSTESLRTLLEAGVMKAVSVIDTFLPLLKLSSQGNIVTISSAGASRAQAPTGLSRTGPYAVTMAALSALTLQYAHLLAPYRIKVNAVAPDADVMGIGVEDSASLCRNAAKLVVQMGTAGPGGPSGAFVSAGGPISW
ncbi:SDR family NAD(P)-dependent oxidoreductase [Paraburkholderia youngii]|uniref:SDR family NAD(P)-dependent oxidoreductase n=1 Tax=Paraburkholderia youngii TaxID=2782701 RepID=UPI003D250B16